MFNFNLDCVCILCYFSLYRYWLITLLSLSLVNNSKKHCIKLQIILVTFFEKMAAFVAKQMVGNKLSAVKG